MSRENVLESYNLVNGAVWWRACAAAVCDCMRPPSRDECSGTPHWPVGCDNLTGQNAFEYAGTVGVLAVAVDSTREGCVLFAWLLHVKIIRTIPDTYPCTGFRKNRLLIFLSSRFSTQFIGFN